MKLYRYCLAICLLLLFVNISNARTFHPDSLAIEQSSLTVEMTNIIVQNIEVEIDIIVADPSLKETLDYNTLPINVNGEVYKIKIVDGKGTIHYKFENEQDLNINIGEYYFTQHVKPIPIWFSVIPPLIAILFALIFKEVFTALFIGILMGTTTIFFHQGYGFFSSVFRGLFAIVDTYLLDSLTENGHMSIIIFSLLIGAMVNIITRNGGMKGVVNIL